MRRGAPRSRGIAAVPLALLAAALCLAGSARAEDAIETRTNLEMAKEAIRGAVLGAIETLPPSDAPVRLVPLVSADVNPLVESVLVEELSARGVALEVQAGLAPVPPAAGDSAADDSIEAVELDPIEISGTEGLRILSYRVTDFSFRYADVYRKYVLGPRRIRRLARADLHLRLSDSSGRTVVWSENAAYSAVDVVGFGDAALLESNAYAFARPERQPSGLARLYEPLIVGGIVAGLIFLFYSNQSGG